MTPIFPQHVPDWSRLVSLDFETYWDADYTLSKMSTSEYVRDSRFKAQMMGIKVGNRKTRIVLARNIHLELLKIDWTTHSLLCHNTAFDGFILSHHYGICPRFYYDSLSMARGLHSNDIGSGLDEVSVFYGGKGKIEGSLDKTRGVRVWDKAMNAELGVYCANDVDEMLRVFKCMLSKMPDDEISLINLTMKMFCDPVLRVDIPRVEKELQRELTEREELLSTIVDLDEYDMTKLLKGKEKLLPPKERDQLMVKRIIGSSERFADLIRAEGIEPPVKISPAWMKLSKEERESEEGEKKKYAYAFAKDDTKFLELPNTYDEWGFDLNKPDQVEMMVARQERLQKLIDARIAVKSTSNITRAERFLTAGANGMPLPIGYSYYRAHCLTGDAQVLTRTGWKRLDEWTGGDIAQWSVDGTISFAPATSNVFQIDETIVVADSRYHCANYTLGHTLPGFTSYGTFAPRQAGNALDARFNIPISGNMDGTNKFITCLEAQIAVMVQADANIRTGGRSGRCVRFGFKKPRKIERCISLLTEAGVPFTQSVVSNCITCIYIGAADMHLVLGLIDETKKQFLTSIYDAPLEAKHAFINELTYWDGDVEPHQKGFTYTTTNKANAELVQTLAHLTGQSAFMSHRIRQVKNWNDSYRVYIRSDKTTRSEPKHYSSRRHTGSVYCPTTETGFFLMRQNGRIVVTGNTGRFGGNNKMNFQNLKRGGELRLSILAPKGYKIAVADSGQIEARVNAWLWGQDDLLDAFRAADQWNKKTMGVARGDNRDAYCKFADHVYGREITTDDSMERFVGKVCTLALGYQMGAPKLQITFAKGALGGKPVYFELEKCQEIVTAYRVTNNMIVAGWKICDRIISDMALGIEGSHGPISWEAGMIWLPNGMALKYPDLKKAVGEKGWPEWSYASTLKGVPIRKKIYSGLLCENIIQALARIIVMWQMLQASKKYRVVMTTHDEFACIAKNSQAEKCFAFITECMKTPPSWCPDLPLNSEGKVDVNYSK